MPEPEPEHDPLLDKPAGVPSWVPSIDDVRSTRRLRRWVIGLLLVGVGACVVRSATRPADPVVDTADGATAASTLALAESFGAVTVTITLADGSQVTYCLLDGDTPEERQRGLMGITDFTDVAGMLFRWTEDATSSFVMIGTPTPLAISWWSADGAYVSGSEMAPCTEGPADECPRYEAAGPYRYAVELPAETAAPLAIGAGARIAVGAACATA